ncbi:unnamed protein product [Cochlearia groenlandica]
MFASTSEVLSRDLRWTADQLNQSVVAHQDERIRTVVADWEADPRSFPLGKFDGASVMMGNSPRFPMYDNDFGWGKPVAVKSGRLNKFDGKISRFRGRKVTVALIWRWFCRRRLWLQLNLTASLCDTCQKFEQICLK